MIPLEKIITNLKKKTYRDAWMKENNVTNGELYRKYKKKYPEKVNEHHRKSNEKQRLKKLKKQAVELGIIADENGQYVFKELALKVKEAKASLKLKTQTKSKKRLKAPTEKSRAYAKEYYLRNKDKIKSRRAADPELRKAESQRVMRMKRKLGLWPLPRRLD